MIYRLNNEFEKESAKTAFEMYCKNGNVIELGKKNFNRTLNQNAYLHLILGWFAYNYGERLEYVKHEIYKKQVNPDLYVCMYANRVTGELREDIKSSRDLSIEDMRISIERFRNFSAKEAGIYLPSSNEHKQLAEIYIEIERNKQWI